MDITCKRCGYKWDYSGKSVFNVTCPRCKIKNQVFLKVNLKYARKANCSICGKEFYKKEKRSKVCSKHCLQVAAARLGNKALRERHAFKGEKNSNWKGGISKYHAKNDKTQVERNPEKVRARKLLNWAVRSGKIMPPSKCERCPSKINIQAHHPDYTKPYDVIWLCKKCHGKIHSKQT